MSIIRRESKKLFKEGAGSGVLITMSDLVGQFDHAVKCDDDCLDVYIKNVSLEDCVIHTYYWSTEKWNFTHGKAVLTYDTSDLTEDEKDELIDDLKHSDGIGTGSCTLTHGGGWVHNSLEGMITCDVYDGIHNDWMHLHSSLRDERWDVNITEIKLDFGKQLEEFYQEGEDNYMAAEEEPDYYSDDQEAEDAENWMNEKRIRNILKQVKVEKISPQKIKSWSKEYSFIWWDLEGTDYTCYSNGYSLIASNDKALRDAVSKEKEQSGFQKGVSKEVYSLIKKVSGSPAGNWMDTSLTVADLKNNPDKMRKEGVKLNARNLTDFLRMFSGYVTAKTPVYYNHFMDAIGLGYKGEVGILMCSN